MRVRVHTSASIFERRGDPWVTDKEGRQNYGRNLKAEDPDMDAFFLAKKAETRFADTNTNTGLHPDLIPRGKAAPKPGKSVTQSPERRFAAAGDRLRKALAKAEVIKIK